VKDEAAPPILQRYDRPPGVALAEMQADIREAWRTRCTTAVVGRLRHPDCPDTLGHRLALSHQSLDLTQLGDDLLRLVMLARHPSPFRVHTEVSPPAEHF